MRASALWSGPPYAAIRKSLTEYVRAPYVRVRRESVSSVGGVPRRPGFRAGLGTITLTCARVRKTGP